MHAWRGSPSKNERFANNKTYILQPLIYGGGVSKLCVFHILVKNKCTLLHDICKDRKSMCIQNFRCPSRIVLMQARVLIVIFSQTKHGIFMTGQKDNFSEKS